MDPSVPSPSVALQQFRFPSSSSSSSSVLLQQLLQLQHRFEFAFACVAFLQNSKNVQQIWSVFARAIWPIFTTNIRHLSFSDRNAFDNLFRHTSPTILISINCIQSISLICFPIWSLMMGQMQLAFLRSITSSASYIIRLEDFEETEIEPFELTNERTNEEDDEDEEWDERWVIKRYQIGQTATIQWEDKSLDNLNNVNFHLCEFGPLYPSNYKQKTAKSYTSENESWAQWTAEEEDERIIRKGEADNQNDIVDKLDDTDGKLDGACAFRTNWRTDWRSSWESSSNFNRNWTSSWATSTKWATKLTSSFPCSSISNNRSNRSKTCADYLFVVGHYPIHSVSEHGSFACLRQLDSLLHSQGANAYFSGHDHTLQHFRFGAVPSEDAKGTVAEDRHIHCIVFSAASLTDRSAKHIEAVPKEVSDWLEPFLTNWLFQWWLRPSSASKKQRHNELLQRHSAEEALF
ncbi:hypothetical protein niasHT_029686 [Heterodera trifolii]|uniref:Calcineurin-like phosphoesterase domain-containing protein n=1 Tax=Heterodera trifolii TaxID=157864 RepID=A0ABD2KT29_9BILA